MNEQTPLHPYEEEGYEVLCDIGEQMHAGLLLDELQAANIDAIQYPTVEETGLNFPPPETSTGIRIFVPKEQLTEAKALFEQLEKNKGEE